MHGGPGGSTGLTRDEVESVRALLRRSDDGSRRDALERIDGWHGQEPDGDAAVAILRAATLAYPWVKSQRTDPGLYLARVLCRCPRTLDVNDVEAAYLVSGERVRRVLLHVLALRRDGAGIGSLAYLLGPDGPQDLLPLPTGGLLSPALDVVSAPDLAPALVHAAAQPGWAWHASEMLAQLVRDERLSDAATAAVVDGLAPVLEELVRACDRLWSNDDHLGLDDRDPPPVDDRDVTSDRHPIRRDPTRGVRFRLRSLVDLYRVLPADPATRVLERLLASADPRVAAMGYVALADHGARIAPERADLLARDAEARAELLDGLSELGRLDRLSPEWRSGRARAEAELVRWLASDTELGVRPDEVDHVAALALGEHPDDGTVHLFRFRLRPPHWSTGRGWMIGAAGPFHDDGTPAGHEVFASSVYAADDDDDHEGHLESILDALEVWPDVDDR